MFTKGSRMHQEICNKDIYIVQNWYGNLIIPTSSKGRSVCKVVVDVANAQDKADKAKRNYDAELRRFTKTAEGEYKKSILTPKRLFTDKTFLKYFIISTVCGILIPGCFWVGPIVGLLLGRKKVWDSLPEDVKSGFDPDKVNLTDNPDLSELKNTWDAAEDTLVDRVRVLENIPSDQWNQFLEEVETKTKAEKARREAAERAREAARAQYCEEDSSYSGEGILHSTLRAMVGASAVRAGVRATKKMQNSNTRSYSEPSKPSYSEVYSAQMREKRRNEFIYGGGKYSSPSQRASGYGHKDQHIKDQETIRRYYNR